MEAGPRLEQVRVRVRVRVRVSVEAGPRLEQVRAAGVAQRVQVGHEAEVGQGEVRTLGLGLGSD